MPASRLRFERYVCCRTVAPSDFVLLRPHRCQLCFTSANICHNHSQHTTSLAQAASQKLLHKVVSSSLASCQSTFKTLWQLHNQFCTGRSFPLRLANSLICLYGAPTLMGFHDTVTSRFSYIHLPTSLKLKLPHPLATCQCLFHSPAALLSTAGS